MPSATPESHHQNECKIRTSAFRLLHNPTSARLSRLAAQESHKRRRSGGAAPGGGCGSTAGAPARGDNVQ